MLISNLLFLSHSYAKLKEIALSMNHNMLNYLTNKAHLFNFFDEKEEGDSEKTVKKIFDKSDLLSDKDR